MWLVNRCSGHELCAQHLSRQWDRIGQSQDPGAEGDRVGGEQEARREGPKLGWEGVSEAVHREGLPDGVAGEQGPGG